MNEQGLSRTEAILLNAWFFAEGITVPSGWVGLWKRTPSDIAKDYEVDLDDVIRVIRR